MRACWTSADEVAGDALGVQLGGDVGVEGDDEAGVDGATLGVDVADRRGGHVARLVWSDQLVLAVLERVAADDDGAVVGSGTSRRPWPP